MPTHRAMNFNRGPGHIRIGKLLLTWNNRIYGNEPWLDGCWTQLHHQDKPTEHFGGFAIRKPWRRGPHMGLSITWLGARTPSPHRWKPSRLTDHIRWVRAGRPVAVPLGPDDAVTGNYEAR